MYIYFFAFFLPCAHPILFSMKVRSVSVAVFFLLYLINTLSSSCFWGFLKKKHRNAHGFAREFLLFSKCYGPGWSVKRHGKSSSLHSKKIFWLGVAYFLWVTS